MLKGDMNNEKRGLHHLTISVSSLEKSQRFYKKLGFIYSRDFERKDYPAKFRDMLLENFTLRLVEYEGNLKKIPLCYKNPIKNFKTLGLKHFALQVQDILKFKKDSKLSNYIFLDGMNKKAQIQQGITEVNYIFLKDLDNNLIELVEDNKSSFHNIKNVSRKKIKLHHLTI